MSTQSQQPSPELKTVENLRQVFSPLTHRLTPDVEPAMIYRPSLCVIPISKEETQKEDR